MYCRRKEAKLLAGAYNVRYIIRESGNTNFGRSRMGLSKFPAALRRLSSSRIISVMRKRPDTLIYYHSRRYQQGFQAILTLANQQRN
jgi:hypothetical protein